MTKGSSSNNLSTRSSSLCQQTSQRSRSILARRETTSCLMFTEFTKTNRKEFGKNTISHKAAVLDGTQQLQNCWVLEWSLGLWRKQIS